MKKDESCEACGDAGTHIPLLGLCFPHLEEWLRSPERACLPEPVMEDSRWDAAMDRFIARKRKERSRAHLN